MAITKVTNSLVAVNAIQGTLIADNAITSVHIAQNQVTAVQIPDGSITSTQIAANSIDTAELVTGSIDTIHIGDSQVTTAKIADLNVTTGKIANNAITSAKIPDGSITATQLDSSTAPTFGNITTTGSLRGPASFTIDPAAVGDNTGTVVIAGSLQVDGTTTTVNSTTLSVADKNIVIASGAADAAAANEAGLTVTGASATLLYKSSGDKWEFNKSVNFAGNIIGNDIKAAGSGGLSLQTDEGTKRIFIADSGDVKVGQLAVGSATTAPLHVAKASTDCQAIFGDNNSSIDDPSIRIIGRDSGNSAIRYTFLGLDADSNYGYLGYNAGAGGFVNALNFDTSGKVGIGTASPAGMLHIQSEDSTTNATVNMLWLTALSTGTTTTGFGPAIVFQAERNSGVNQNVGKISSIAEINSGTNISSGLAFETGEVGVLSEKLRITYDGDVGIGTSSPTGNLHVYNDGTGNAAYIESNYGWTAANLSEFSNSAFTIRPRSSDIYLKTSGSANDVRFQAINNANDAAKNIILNPFGGSIGVRETNPQRALHVDSGTTNVTARFESSDAVAAIEFVDSGGSAEVGCSSNDVVFFPAGAEKMRIDSSGKLGIGTSSPNRKLHIYESASNTSNFIQMTTAGTGQTGSNGLLLGVSSEGDAEIWNYESRPIKFATSSTERMQINSSGDVGVGTSTPFGATTNRRCFSINGTSSTSLNIGVGNSQKGYLYSDGNMTQLGSVGAIPLKFAPNDTERMVIDTSGNVGIGTSSPGFLGLSGSGRVLHLGGTNTQLRLANSIIHHDNAGLTQLTIRNNYGATSNSALIKYEAGYHSWRTTTAFDEKMRLSGSTLYVSTDIGAHSNVTSYAHSTYAHAAVFGANSVPDGTVVIEDYDVSSGIGNTVLKLYLRDEDPATNAKFITFGDGGGAVGSIIHNDDGGGVTYNTTSDYRLKENVEYNWDATTLLKQLKPAKFNFKRAPGKTVQGMLAHEVSDIVPYSVTGEKDHMMEIGTIKDSDNNIVYEGVYEHFCKTDEGQTWTQTGTEPYYQELDYSRLVPLLTKAMQEQQTIIDDLKSRIETLEG